MKKINAEDAKGLADVDEVFRTVEPQLTTEDDPSLWELALSVIAADFEKSVSVKSKEQYFLQVGACSHWVRPHQTRWTAAGGFAWPSGYRGGAGHDLGGLPELDWFVVFMFENEKWIPVQKFSGKKQLVMRVALPTRTTRHRQAAVHTICNRMTRFYGFRKLDEQWSCVAVSN